MQNSFHQPGHVVGGRYTLVELAGQGGMAEVWRAELMGAQGFRRPVALKRILKHLVNSADHRAMFVQEARLTATLDHPNVVQIYDFGEDVSGLYIAMEWVEGLSASDLAQLCEANGVQMSATLVAAVGIEVLRGLEAAHDNVVLAPDGSTRRAPIIHRDISPSNVMLSIRGVVKLADFGLARALYHAGSLTPPGVVKGKLGYMAPEVLRGDGVSPQSDLYSCGVMLWELMCGRRLYRHENDVIHAVLRGAAPPSVREHRPDVPGALADAIDRALAPDAARRYPSASAFARVLSDVLRTIPERTDTSRLAREVTTATAAWRRLRAQRTGGGLAAAPPRPASDAIPVEISGADVHPVSDSIPVVVSEVAARPTVPEVRVSRRQAPEPRRSSVERNTTASVAASSEAVEYLSGAMLLPEASALHAPVTAPRAAPPPPPPPPRLARAASPTPPPPPPAAASPSPPPTAAAQPLAPATSAPRAAAGAAPSAATSGKPRKGTRRKRGKRR